MISEQEGQELPLNFTDSSFPLWKLRWNYLRNVIRAATKRLATTADVQRAFNQSPAIIFIRT